MDLTPWMERWHMLPEKGGVILCAVSGGRDSICLLDYLHTLGQERGFTAAAGHLNHLMRPTAQRDEDFVRSFCARRDIPFYTERADVYALCGTWGLTVEETGRRARYEFLQRTAEVIGAEKIATAHHQNDLAETVLLQLLRGTGPQGLTGIPPVRGNIVRPLLDTPRRDIERYIAEHELAYVTDETNGDTAYARNRLRLEIWPELEGINPRAAEHIACTADILRREDAYLDALAAERLRSTGTGVDCEALLAAPEALRPRMLRLLLDRLPTGRKDLGAVHLTALEQLAPLEGITTRQMMGEYIIYYQGKIAAELCDDRLLVKPVPAALALLPDAPQEPPYPGAKPMLLVEEVDDGAFLRELLVAMEPELPAPKPKKPMAKKE